MAHPHPALGCVQCSVGMLSTDQCRPPRPVHHHPLAACAGEKEQTPFDQAVLERLADSLLALPADQLVALRLANPGNAGLAKLREFMLATLLRRYLGRCHVPHDSAQRSAVNAVRLLEASWGDRVGITGRRRAVCESVGG